MLPNGIGNLLLVSDTQLLSPLLGPLEQALADGLAVTLVLEASRAANLYPAAQLPPAVELQAATHDGSQGHRGTIAPLLPGLLRWADAVYAAGTADLYRTLQQQTQSVRFGLQSGFLYGLIDTSPMACGVGACFSCTIETKFGLKLTCVDGPVFDLSAVELERP